MVAESNMLPWWQAVARTLAWNAPADRGPEDGRTWADVRADRLAWYVAQLPRGSGIDAGVTLDEDASGAERVVLRLSFHHMNDGGMYDGWTEHSAIIRPSLAWGYEMRVTGRDRNGIKEYLADTLREAVTRDVPEYPEAARTEA